MVNKKSPAVKAGEIKTLSTLKETNSKIYSKG